MFGRSIKLSLEKDKKQQNPEASNTASVSDAAVVIAEISTVVETVGKTIMKGVLIYIAADTARKVIVKSTKEG
jgi:hypothetical protein